jgi:hypothetical protein
VHWARMPEIIQQRMVVVNVQELATMVPALVFARDLIWLWSDAILFYCANPSACVTAPIATV